MPVGKPKTVTFTVRNAELDFEANTVTITCLQDVPGSPPREFVLRDTMTVGYRTARLNELEQFLRDQA